MQTVINNYNIINGPVIGSAVAQGSSGCSVSAVSGGEIGGFISEVLRIFTGLDMRRQVAALAYLYDLEAGNALPTGK